MTRDHPAVLGLRIRREKVVDYLLDPTHPKGGSKAAFLLRFGFTVSQPEFLADALSRHFTEAPDTRTVIDAIGSTRIICDGPLQGLDGRKPMIRSVWLVEPDRYARLLTVVPRPSGAGST